MIWVLIFTLKLLTCTFYLCAPGNTFYLVMPTELGESVTDDPPTPTASHFPEPLEEAMSPQTRPQEETLARGPEPDHSEAMQLEQGEETGQSRTGHQSHVIKNVDEIFHTIEGLMSKLRQLKVSLCSVSHQPIRLLCVNSREAGLNIQLAAPLLCPGILFNNVLTEELPRFLFSFTFMRLSFSLLVVFLGKDK